MKKTTRQAKQKKVGVVIGRFQVPTIHIGHRYLIDTVVQENDELCILLGGTGGAPTKRNPLSFTHRKEMIQELYPNASVFELIDSEIWSENLDKFLKKTFKGKLVKLYGSRDSFAKEYFGTHEVVHVEPIHNISGTELRNKNIVPKEKESFRQGIIESHKHRYPISYQTVDAIILDTTKKKVLLGKKSKNNAWYLPGGFVDPTDMSLEKAVLRELSEEVIGLTSTSAPIYLGSHRVDDHRYRNEEDKIMTSVFLIESKGGRLKAGDDLQKVQWYSFADAKKAVARSHAPLLEMFLSKISKEKL